MGEKIKVITTKKLKDIEYDIELNDGTAKSKKPQYIHIQNKRFRLAVSDSEYIQMAVAIRAAARKMEDYKNIDAERLISQYNAEKNK